MSALVAKGVQFLLKQLAMDPKLALKVLFIGILLPLAFLIILVIGPITLITRIPMIKSDQFQQYIDVTNKIKHEKNVQVDWHNLVGIDAVLLNQDFSNVSKNHIQSIANHFVMKDTVHKQKTIMVHKTCIRFDENGRVIKEMCEFPEKISYTTNGYKLRPLKDVLNILVKKGMLQKKQISLVMSYIQNSSTSDASANLKELPKITNGIFMRPATGRITSGFGMRWGEFHFGVDIGGGGRKGVPIVAVADGVVDKSYKSTTYGECIMIIHHIKGVLYESVYAHMSLGSRRVKVGDHVKKGTIIGIMGSTGDSTGEHLHFELHKGGKWNFHKTFAVNPIYYINFNE